MKLVPKERKPLTYHSAETNATDMLEELIYHYDLYVYWWKKDSFLRDLYYKLMLKNWNHNFIGRFLQKIDKKSSSKMEFEIKAYLATLGRLYYYISSKKLLKLAPLMKHFIILRHKHVAHRSIDVPKKEYLPHFAKNMDAFFGKINRMKDRHIVFPMPMAVKYSEIKEKRLPVEFNLYEDHKKIISEILLVFEELSKNI